MKILTKTLLTLTSLLFISCGENTETNAVADIKSVEINSTDINIYSTDSAISFSANAKFDDGSNRSITDLVDWSSSTNVVDISSDGTLRNLDNGGESNISIDYEHFTDKINVKVAKLTSINYSDINISDTSNAQTIYFSGNFDNNDTNVSMKSNLVWLTDSNATISDVNSSSVTLTLHDTQTLLYATLLNKEVFCYAVTKKLLDINFSDVNSSDINSTKIVYISGNYENNETNATLIHHITWQSDENATIIDNNSTQIRLNIHNLPTSIKGTIFSGTGCDKSFTKSWL